MRLGRTSRTTARYVDGYMNSLNVIALELHFAHRISTAVEYQQRTGSQPTGRCIRSMTGTAQVPEREHNAGLAFGLLAGDKR